MAFIWHSPRESRLHSASENACQPKIRRIVPELHVLYNVVHSWLYESNALLLLWQDIKVNDAFSSYLQATLAILDKLDIETENPTEEEVARKFGWEDDYLADDLSLWQRVKPKIFSLFDEPHSSTCARVR